MQTQSYLGDGLYAEYDGYQIRLYTQQGEQVFLDFSVLQNFKKFVAQLENLTDITDPDLANSNT